MRRLNFRLIVPDGPLRRFRLAEDFGEGHNPREGGASGRAAGMALAWCGLSAGCWLLAQGHVLLPNISFEPVVALADAPVDQRWAMALPAPNGLNQPTLSLRAKLAPTSVHPQQPSSEANGSRFNSLHEPGQGDQTRSDSVVRRDLPKVSYATSVLHQGGEVRRADSAEVEPASEFASNDVEPNPHRQSLHQRVSDDVAPSRSRASSFDATDETIAFAPTTTAANAPMFSSTPAQDDPFEADFVAVRPVLSLPRGEARPAPTAAPAIEIVDKREQSGGKHLLHVGGGCQAAFEASNQVVNAGKAVVGADATSEDYGAVLSRMNVASCRPPRHLSVQVCVAVSERRAIAATVTTSPANVSVANCIARQASGLRFPASTGVDLVRTRIDVE